MKYFIDTEFIEGFRKGKDDRDFHFIDLISIGIVDETGREYYAISNEFDANYADPWVKENVIDKLESKTAYLSTNNGATWKSNAKIANNLEYFINNHPTLGPIEDIEFYGYFADYDWVLFCSLFGRMINLPKGFPKYCKDLKQMIDEKIPYMIFSKRMKFGILGNTITPNMPFAEKLKKIKDHPDYPKQDNEHNALDDAKWNKRLYDFIQTL